MKTNLNVSIDRQPRQMNIDSNAVFQVKKNVSDEDLLDAVDHRNESSVVAQLGKDTFVIDSHSLDGNLRVGDTISMGGRNGTITSTSDGSGEDRNGRTLGGIAGATMFSVAATIGLFPPVTAVLAVTTLVVSVGYGVISKATADRPMKDVARPMT